MLATLGRAVQTVIVGAIVVAIVAAVIARAANYNVTQGTGTSFASLVIGGVNYAAQLICDATAGSTQCAAVNGSGQIAVQAPPSLPLPAGAATSALQTTGNSTLTTIANNTGAAIPAGPNGIGTINSQYPTGATPISITATGTTLAVTATLAASAATTTYLCGFSVRANATAATTLEMSITGTITNNLNFLEWIAPNASGLGVVEPGPFVPCLPATATNTTISINSAPAGSGGLTSVSAWGYQK